MFVYYLGCPGHWPVQQVSKVSWEFAAADQHRCGLWQIFHLLFSRSCSELFSSPPGSISSTEATAAIYLKARSLFSLCDFEHSLMMFHRGDRLQSQTALFQSEIHCYIHHLMSVLSRKGIQNCEESVRNMLESKGRPHLILLYNF